MMTEPVKRVAAPLTHAISSRRRSFELATREEQLETSMGMTKDAQRAQLDDFS